MTLIVYVALGILLAWVMLAVLAEFAPLLPPAERRTPEPESEPEPEPAPGVITLGEYRRRQARQKRVRSAP